MCTVYCVMCMVVITADKKYDQILYNYGHASGNFFFVKHDKNSTFFYLFLPLCSMKTNICSTYRVLVHYTVCIYDTLLFAVHLCVCIS